MSLLIFFPAIAFISWANVNLGNFHYETIWYILTFILPAWLFAYIISFSFAWRFKLTTQKVFLTFVIGLVSIFFLLKVTLSFVGLQQVFLTAAIVAPQTKYYQVGAFVDTCSFGEFSPGCRKVDPSIQAKFIYIPDLLISTLVIYLDYFIASGILLIIEHFNP